VSRGKFSDLFHKNVRRALIAAVGLAVFQQLMGCNTVIYYAPKVLELAGFTTFQSRLATVAIGVANVVATLLAISVVDKFNRKTLFIVGGLGMALFTGLFALLINLNFYTPDSNDHDKLALNFGANSTMIMVFAVLLLGLYIIAFGVSWGGTMWVVLGEIFPNTVRGIGVGAGSMTNWISNTFVTAIFPLVIALVGLASSYWILFAFCILGVLFVVKFLPETKGKTLEEIEAEIAR
jgi:MFS family permease